MTTSVSISPPPIQAFLNNAGRPNVGGYILTQVGGVNYPTYQDSGGATPLPNPIPLNSRGEISNASGVSCQLFLETGIAYTFTMYDVNGNQLNQATYVTPPLTATAVSPFTETTIGASQSLALANTGNVYICTAALTLTVAQSTLLNTSWFNKINAYGGAVTITPYTTDQINGGGAGVSLVIPQGFVGNLYTDASGNLYVDYNGNAGASTVLNSGLITIASATTPDIFAAAGNTINYTGTAICTGFVAAPKAGMTRRLVCAGACLFTAGANLLIEGIKSGITITLAPNAIVDVTAITTTQFKMTYSLSGTFTATATGFTGSVFAPAVFSITNGIATISFNQTGAGLSGTSNATTFTITGMPSCLVPPISIEFPIYDALDSGAQCYAYIYISAGSNVITAYKNHTSGAWTASGTKSLFVNTLIYSLSN